MVCIVFCICSCGTIPDEGQLPASKEERVFTLDTDQLYFAPRVKTLEFDLTNITGNNIVFAMHRSGNAGKYLENSTPGMTSDWTCSLPADKTKHIIINANHIDIGTFEGKLRIQGGDNQEWKEVNLPVIVETSSRDFMANVVGTVTDTMGNPIEGVLMSTSTSDATTYTDKDGRYAFDDLEYESSFRILASSDRYVSKYSEFYEYKPQEYEINFTLEPCGNHLSFDHDAIDFGTGSISASDIDVPETIIVTVTADKDEEVEFALEVVNTEFGVCPGLNYWPTSFHFRKSIELYFQYYRSVSKVGTFKLIAHIRTNTAGAYQIPISITNTP